jgi:hemerythrin
MPLMEWNDRLSVGIQQFDNEHKRLVAMVNELFDAAQGNRGKEVLGKILDGLITYTKTHFANEERYMTQHAYPDLKGHKAEHDALAKQVLDVQAKYKGGASSALNMEVLNFLKGWLVKHIQGTDKKYGPFLNAKGVK